MSADRNNEPTVKPQKDVLKKPYQAPAFRFEKAFETLALSCGKVSSTQGTCHNNLRNS